MKTIREFEKIFADDCAHFDELSKFVEAGEFLSLGWQRNGGAFVQAKNFVGVIRLPGGFQVEILPKLDAPEEKLRGLVVEMIRALKNFAGKKISRRRTRHGTPAALRNFYPRLPRNDFGTRQARAAFVVHFARRQFKFLQGQVARRPPRPKKFCARRKIFRRLR